MVAEWPWQKISSLGKVVTGKTPSTRDSGNFSGPYPFITIPDLGRHVYIRDTARAISEQGAELLNSCLLPANAVMMSCIATVGKCGITVEPSFTNQQINSVICNKNVEPRYLYYCFRQLKFQLEATGGGGSVYTNVSKSRFSELEVPLPPLPEQRAIAAILGVLDDKIELNRQMNQTLEAMAQALFKSWFVDFEPFRDQGMEESVLGPIPQGWRYATVSEAIEINPSRKVERGADAIYVDMASLPTTSARVLTVIRRAFTGSGSRFTNGDILLARITPCLENGKTAIVDFLEDGENGWGSTEFIILGPKPPLSTPFIYCLARNADFRTHAIQAMTGTSGRQRVDTSCFNNYWLAVPPKSVAERFDHKVEPWFQMMKANDDESHVLATIRDALLPKLVSGEIRVRDDEKFVEKAI